jgi:hypothetical protein
MMTAQELLEQNGIWLKSYKPGQYFAICPECSHKRLKAHQRTPCLGVKIDDRGATWHCNHCGWSGPEKGWGKSNGRDRHHENVEAVYDYIGFQKVRYPKGHEPRFRVRHSNGRGGWTWGAGKADTNVLYRKPEIDEAVELGHIIVVAEGEKDVDRLWSIGIRATCNSQGTSEPGRKPNWKIEHSKQLRGADIVVIPDHDPPGYAHADATCRLSLGIAKRVRRLVLREHWPECPKGGDVSDWLDAGHSREELDMLLAEAPDYAPGTTSEQPSDGGPAEQAPQILPLHWHGEKDPLDSRSWAVQDLIPEVGTGIIAGQWGTLKTFVAFELAHCIMTPRPFIGFDIVRPGGVLLLALEGQSEVAIRFQGVLEKKGSKYLSGAPFAWTEVSPPLTDPKTADVIIRTAQGVATRLKQQFDLPLSLILVDSLVAGAGYRKEGQDNDAAVTHAIMTTMAQVSRALGCFAFVIDHYGKDTNVGTRGSSVKEGDADVIFACLGDRSEGGQVSNSRLALRKRRSGANGEEFSFRGRVVEMGLNKKTGKMETTLVLDWGDARQPATASNKNDWGRSKGVKLLRRIIMNLLVDCGEQIKPFADGPLVRALKVKLVEEEFYKAYLTTGETDATKKNAKRMAFQRAIDNAGDKITTRDIGGVDYIWLSQAGPGETAGAAGPGSAPEPGSA